MADPAVHWHEGMLLRPQHFQAADRHWQDHLHCVTRWGQSYHWGLRTLVYDTEQLKAGLFAVRKLEARLEDGTVVRVPENGLLPPLELGPDLGEKGVKIHLAVPILNLGDANVATESNTIARFRVEQGQDGSADENNGRPAGDVLLRRLTVKLLVPPRDDVAGYATLPLARVRRSNEGGEVARLDPSYIPPLLACDAWDPLYLGVLRQLDGRVAAVLGDLDKKARGKVRVGSNNPDEILLLEKFRLVNEAAIFLRVFVRAVGIHPLDAYLELCRLLGRLAVLGTDMPPFETPPYNHNDLGTCFVRVQNQLNELLKRNFLPGYFQSDFVGTGLSLTGEIEESWLAPECRMYVGVDSSLAPDECERILTGRLNMKIAAYKRVEQVFVRGERGLDFRYDSNPPRLLPSGQNMTYFQIDRDVSPEEWVHVKNTRLLSVRLNEDLLDGVIDGKTKIELLTDGDRRVEIGFSLFVVPPSTSPTEGQAR